MIVDEAARCVTAGYAQRLDWETENFVAQAYGGNNTKGPISVATAVNAHGSPAGRIDFESETFVAHSLRAEGYDASEDGTGRGTPIVPIPMTLAIRGRDGEPDIEWRQDGTANAILTPNGGRAGMGVGAIAHAIQAGALRENPNSGPDGVGVQSGVSSTLEARAEVQAVAFGIDSDCLDRSGEGAGGSAGERSGLGITEGHINALRAKRPNAVATEWAVRRLTPRECERLQGFPDDFTNVPYRGKPAADGPRYKALGNSMAVNAMRWIGQRIDIMERLLQQKEAAE
ncbi:hypothetical protein ATY75_12120 [Rhizobium sp. N122]|nr:hypothetical protein ATY75_12120 [Rhizobium sp. N122]